MSLLPNWTSLHSTIRRMRTLLARMRTKSRLHVTCSKRAANRSFMLAAASASPVLLKSFARLWNSPVYLSSPHFRASVPFHPLTNSISACSACTAQTQANLAVQECDLLICVAARFDDRVTGKLKEFAPHAKVIHMDIDPAEVSKLRAADCSIVGDVKVALNFLHVRPQIDEWRERCLANKAAYEFKYDVKTEHVYAPKNASRFERSSIRRHRYLVRCRTTPDVGRPALPVQRTGKPPHKRWIGHYGLWNAGRHRRAARQSQGSRDQCFR